MLHDKEHRAIVRSGIDSALETYVASGSGVRSGEGEGERHPTSTKFLSTSGGSMAIGSGCFLIRPRKPQTPSGDDSPPLNAPQDGGKSTVDSTDTGALLAGAAPLETTTPEDNHKPAEIAPALGSAEDGAGSPRRRDSSPVASGSEGGEKDYPEGDIVAHVSADDGNPDPHTDDEKKSDENEETSALHQVEGAADANDDDDAAVTMEAEAVEESPSETVEVGGATGHKPSSPTDSVNRTVTQADGEERCAETVEGQPTTEQNSVVSGEPSRRNLVLDALLRDMTSAAEAWSSASAARLATAGRHQEATATTEKPSGCTIIVLLDAPLIASDLSPRTRALGERGALGRRIPLGNEARPLPEASFREPSGPPEAPDGKLAESQPTTARSNPTSVAAASSTANSTSGGVLPTAGEAEDMSRSRDAASSSGDDDGDVSHEDISSVEEHPAGLGDPQEALESLLSWMDEGSTSVLCRREILLICSHSRDPRNDDPGSSSQAESAAADDPDESSAALGGQAARGRKEGGEASGARGRGVRVIQHLLGARRDERAREGGAAGESACTAARASDVDAISQETGEGEPAEVDRPNDGASAGGDGGDKDEGNRARGTIRQIVLGGTVPIPVFHETEGATITPRQDRGNDDPANKAGAPAAAERKKRYLNRTGRSSPPGTQPTTVADRAPLFTRLPPSEVLLQTRPASPNRDGLSRMTVTFPPQTTDPVSATVPTSPGGVESRAPTVAPEAPPVAPPRDPGPSLSYSGVRVVVGPVVGRVGPTSGVVLVEVDAAPAGAGAVRSGGSVGAVHPSDRVGVRLTDTLTGRTREMAGGAWAAGKAGGGPRIFEFEGLSPGRRYTLKLVGVRRRDQVSRTYIGLVFEMHDHKLTVAVSGTEKYS